MNDAPGRAAVHVVIVGFAAHDAAKKFIFEYTDIKGAAHETVADNINPYLVDAPDVVLPNRRDAICEIAPWQVPPIVFGSMPNDGGHLLLSDEERTGLIAIEPDAEQWLRPFVSADEFINKKPRWCLWFEGIDPHALKSLPEIRKRVDAVREHRKNSNRPTTRALADYPTLFGENRQPNSEYILVPRHSSERRAFIPLGFMPPTAICADSCLAVYPAARYHFGLLMSTMHMAWVRYVCGRLESRYRYSNGIVYNNFPWPEKLTAKHREAVEIAAEGVLGARRLFPDASLAELYNPTTMPPALAKAHAKLDQVVDAAYVPDGGRRTWANDSDRVVFLFRRYARITSLLPAAADSGGSSAPN